MTVFIKTMKIHYVLKGIHENPKTRITKKRSQQQTTRPSVWCSRWGILIQSCWNVHKSQAKTSGRGQRGSTIIIFKELIRFNNSNNFAKPSKTQVKRTKHIEKKTKHLVVVLVVLVVSFVAFSAIRKGVARPLLKLVRIKPRKPPPGLRKPPPGPPQSKTVCWLDVTD